MTIPQNLTHEEVGALLIVVGQHMVDHNVAAEVVLDWDSYADPVEGHGDLICGLQDLLPELAETHAEEILQLTLAEAIAFNEFESNP